MNNHAIRLTLSAFAFVALAACHSDLPPQPPMDNGNTLAGAGTGGTGSAIDLTQKDTGPSPTFNKSVYFDYDSFVVKDDQRGVVTQNASWIKTKGSHVIIQGNTDERGGSEYNLALGQKRAEAVRKQLSLLGVADGAMEAVSFGKEKPQAAGHDEAAWAQNRRADIVYN